jgi:hypothetical protein
MQLRIPGPTGPMRKIAAANPPLQRFASTRNLTPGGAAAAHVPALRPRRSAAPERRPRPPAQALGEDVGDRHAVRDHRDHRRDRDSQSDLRKRQVDGQDELSFPS